MNDYYDVRLKEFMTEWLDEQEILSSIALD